MMEANGGKSNVPETFTALGEARDFLNLIVSSLFAIFYSFDPELPFGVQTETIPLLTKYTKQLFDWHKAFEKLMHSKKHLFNSIEIRGAALLKIQHITVSIMANSSSPKLDDPRSIAEIISERRIFEAYNADFHTIINLSRSLIAASEEDSKSGRPAFNFSADLGITGPIYFCCVKAADPAIRTAALDLLRRCRRREGMWDSNSLVPIVEGYLEIEARHDALQEEIVDGNGQPMSLATLLDLDFQDGMKWEWKWKDIASTTKHSTSHSTWAEVLEDRTVTVVREKR